MTYVEYSSTVRGTLPYFSMKNRANKAVTPSPASVQAAMTDYAAALNSGFLPPTLQCGPPSELPGALTPFFVGGRRPYGRHLQWPWSQLLADGLRRGSVGA